MCDLGVVGDACGCDVWGVMNVMISVCMWCDMNAVDVCC